MKKYEKMQKWILCLVCGIMMILGLLCMDTTVYAKRKVKLNKTNVTLVVGSYTKLRVIGTKKKVKWYTNHVEVLKVNQKGKIIAKKRGTATVTAKVGSKKIKCKVTVKNPNSAEQILQLVNEERKKRGLAVVTLDKKLTKAANKRAKEISKVFAHVRPDGTTCFTVLNEYNIKCYLGAENIAAGQTSARKVMDAWMQSKGHKNNILNPDVKKIGVGYHKKSDDLFVHYWVQIFTD